MPGDKSSISPREEGNGSEKMLDESTLIKGILSIFDERNPDLLRKAIENQLGYTLSGPRIDALEERQI